MCLKIKKTTVINDEDILELIKYGDAQIRFKNSDFDNNDIRLIDLSFEQVNWLDYITIKVMQFIRFVIFLFKGLK